jgi:DNA-binding MarR family transcriptional regulator
VDRGREIVVEDSGAVSRLVSRVGRAHAGLTSALLHELSLYPGQELLLMHLWEHDHRTQSELTVALEVNPSTVTHTVQCLGRAGLLTRAPSPIDRRAVIVSLTPAGYALRGPVKAVWHRIETVTTCEMSETQRSSTVELLRWIEANLTSGRGSAE